MVKQRTDIIFNSLDIVARYRIYESFSTKNCKTFVKYAYKKLIASDFSNEYEKLYFFTINLERGGPTYCDFTMSIENLPFVPKVFYYFKTKQTFVLQWQKEAITDVLSMKKEIKSQQDMEME